LGRKSSSIVQRHREGEKADKPLRTLVEKKSGEKGTPKLQTDSHRRRLLPCKRMILKTIRKSRLGER